MNRQQARIRGHQGRCGTLTRLPIVRYPVVGAVELGRSSPPFPIPTPGTAVDMTRPWKSQNDFHRRLEISPRTRDSHISTAAPRFQEEEEEEEEEEQKQRRRINRVLVTDAGHSRRGRAR